MIKNYLGDMFYGKINENTYYKNFDSLNQGVELLNERKNYMDKVLKKRKVIEGAATIEEIKTHEENNHINVASQKNSFESNKREFNVILNEYKNSYNKFLNNFKEAEDNVNTCKINCESVHMVPAESEVNVKKEILKKKNACKAGCHFKLPQILTCEDKFGKSNDGDTCETKKMVCGDAQNNTTIQNELRGIVDDEGNNMWEHCCDCDLNRKYKSYYVTDGKKYSVCSDFLEDGEDMVNNSYIQACRAGKDSVEDVKHENSSQTYEFQREYSNITKKNKELIDKSNKLLEIVKNLDGLNHNILQDSKNTTEKIQDENNVLEKINADIAVLSNKSKNITLNQLLNDKYNLKKSTDLRLYLWGILAVGFGISAIVKINKI